MDDADQPDNKPEEPKEGKPNGERAQKSLRQRYTEMTKIREERELAKMRKDTLKQKSINKETTEIAQLRAKICFEEVEDFKNQACARYENAIVAFKESYDNVVGYAKILVNFKAEAKLNVKFIVDCAKKEINAGSRVPQ